MEDQQDQHGNEETQETQVTLTLEQLGQLINKDPLELRSQLIQTNEQGEPLTQQEQFNIIEQETSNYFARVNQHKIGRGKTQAYNELKNKLVDVLGVDRKKDINEMIDSVAQRLNASTQQMNTSKDPFGDERVKDKIQKLQQALELEQNSFKEYKTQQHQQNLWSNALSTMINTLDAKNAFSTNPDVKNNQIKAFSTYIKSVVNLKEEDGKTVVYDKNGTPIDGDNHMPISLAEVAVKNSLFEFNTKPQKPQGFYPQGEGQHEKGFKGFTEDELKNALVIEPKIRMNNPQRANELLKAAREYRNKNKK